MRELAETITGGRVDVRSSLGCQIVNHRTGEVVYTPPVGRERILGMLEDLCRFVAGADGVDPLIAMTAAHRQFEAIHPFPDGNGRIGRVLNILSLVQSGLLTLPVLYLSGYLVRRKSEYYRLLQAVSERGDWDSWGVFMLGGVAETAGKTLSMLARVQECMQHWTEVARLRMSRGYSRELIEVVFSHPCTRIQHVTEAGIAHRNTASLYLRELERIGLLRASAIGREHLFINVPLMESLQYDAAG